MNRYFSHNLADVQSKSIGAGTRIWQYTVVLAQAKIGVDCNICTHCFIENDVQIGDRVTIKSGVSLWDGISVDNDAFIGPNVSFTNDKFPRSKQYPTSFLKTHIGEGASIGAGAVILGGITIGKKAMIGAGAVVTKSVPPYAVVVGNPARIEGYVDSYAHSNTEKVSPSSQASSESKTTLLGVGNAALYHFKICTDIRGDLSVGNFTEDFPFRPKRYFVVYNVPSHKVRGEHAHLECDEFLICVKGKCNVMLDRGTARSEVVLDSPNLGLYVPAMTWRAQYKFSSDAVLFAFASELYDTNDYIRDYDDYLKVLAQKSTN